MCNVSILAFEKLTMWDLDKLEIIGDPLITLVGQIENYWRIWHLMQIYYFRKPIRGMP